MNRQRLKDMIQRVLTRVPAVGDRQPLATILSQSAAEPRGVSDARAAILELIQKGVLRLDDAGYVERLKSA